MCGDLYVSCILRTADHIVPAILGRGGEVIRELIQQVTVDIRLHIFLLRSAWSFRRGDPTDDAAEAQTGASINVSKKGELVPGTNNRIVVIEGACPLAVRPCPPMVVVSAPTEASVASLPDGPAAPPSVGASSSRAAGAAGSPEAALFAHQLVQERIALRMKGL